MMTTGDTRALSAEDDPLVGKVLRSRYELLERIGAGGMGRIYRASQRPLERLVALKVLDPRLTGGADPAFEERFFLEASMTARLRHANTVTLYDYGRSEEGLYFMALELLEGQTLRELLTIERSIPWPRALRIGAQVAASLREAHRLGWVHRDLKPANVMLLDEGPLGDRVKVLDFGLVKHVSLLAAAARGLDPEDLTEAGVVLGSPQYMAPEQARKTTDIRSDVYSLGAVLFAAIAGRTPFLGGSPMELMLKHLRDPPPQLSAFADVPSCVNALVMRCLQKAPEDRFQDADDLLRAMRRALAEAPRPGWAWSMQGVAWRGEPRRPEAQSSEPRWSEEERAEEERAEEERAQEEQSTGDACAVSHREEKGGLHVQG